MDTGGCGTMFMSRARLTPLETGMGHVSSMSVQADLAGCEMPVTAVHLTRPFPFDLIGEQMKEASYVSDQTAAWSGAQLVVGDFNAAPWGHVMKSIVRGGRLELLTGSGGTWPSAMPRQVRIPIDHMMVGRGLSFVSRALPGAVGSDHVPVLARVAVTDPAMCGGAGR